VQHARHGSLPTVISFSLDGECVKSFSYTPGYIYLIAGVLAFPATWLVVGRSGEDVPGMIAMVAGILFFGFFAFGLASLRRSLLNRYSRNADSEDDLR